MRVELLKPAVRLLTSSMRYDLRIDLARMPALPASRFVISGLRPAP